MNSINFIVQKFKSLDNFSKWNLFIGGTMVLTVLLLYFKYTSFAYEFHLSMVPDGLNVSKILYINEQGLGLGPGDNETGIIVYELSDTIAAEVQKVGISYFVNIPPNKGENRKWRGDYSHWNSTPILSEESTPALPSTLKILKYLNQYGFGLEIDPLIEKQIDDALSNSRSYVSYGRTGMLIVAPEIKRVFYAYAG